MSIAARTTPQHNNATDPWGPQEQGRWGQHGAAEMDTAPLAVANSVGRLTCLSYISYSGELGRSRLAVGLGAKVAKWLSAMLVFGEDYAVCKVSGTW